MECAVVESTQTTRATHINTTKCGNVKKNTHIDTTIKQNEPIINEELYVENQSANPEAAAVLISVWVYVEFNKCVTV